MKCDDRLVEQLALQIGPCPRSVAERAALQIFTRCAQGTRRHFRIRAIHTHVVWPVKFCHTPRTVPAPSAAEMRRVAVERRAWASSTSARSHADLSTHSQGVKENNECATQHTVAAVEKSQTKYITQLNAAADVNASGFDFAAQRAFPVLSIHFGPNEPSFRPIAKLIA